MNISLVETETAEVEVVDEAIRQLHIAEVGDEEAVTTVAHLITMLHNTKACKDFVLKVSDAISADENVDELRAFMKYLELDVNDQAGVASYIKVLIKPDTTNDSARRIDDEIKEYSRKSFEYNSFMDNLKQIKKEYLHTSGASSIMGGKSLFPYFGDSSTFYPLETNVGSKPKVYVLNANKNVSTQMTDPLAQLKIDGVLAHDNYLQNDELSVTEGFEVAQNVQSLKNIREDQLKCGLHTKERLEEFNLDETKVIKGILNFIKTNNVLIRYPCALHVGKRGDVSLNMIVENVVFNIADESGKSREIKIVLALSMLKTGLGYKSDIVEYTLEGIASSMSGFAITAIDTGNNKIGRAHV